MNLALNPNKGIVFGQLSYITVSSWKCILKNVMNEKCLSVLKFHVPTV